MSDQLSCPDPAGANEHIRMAVIRRTDLSTASVAPAVISNGFITATFDAMGFMNPSIQGRTALEIAVGTDPSLGETTRAALAVIRSHVADAHPLNPQDCHGYVQEFDRLTGTLITTYDLYGPTRITAYASLDSTNLLVYRIERTPCAPGRVLHLEIETETAALQTDSTAHPPVAATFVHHHDDPVLRDRVQVNSRLHGTTIRWVVQCPGAKLEVRGTHVHVRLDLRPDGSSDHTLRLWIERTGGADDIVLTLDPNSLREANARAWHSWWRKAWMMSPQPSSPSKAASLGRWAGDVMES